MKKRMPLSNWVWLGLGLAYFFIPLAATLEFSLKEASGYGFSSYRQILDDPQFRDLLWVSFKLALATIVVSLLIFIPTVYWVHLRVPRLRPMVEFLSVLPFVVPPIVLVIPLFQIAAALRQLNTYQTVIVIYTGMLLPFSTFLLASFFRTLSPSLVEAARMDGAGSWRIFRSILLPLSGPALATVVTVPLCLGLAGLHAPVALATPTPSGTVVHTKSPVAATSTSGPKLVHEVGCPCQSTAPTASTAGSRAGKRTTSRPSLPAEATTSTPASAAAEMACSTSSSTAGSMSSGSTPSEMLTTLAP